MSDFIAFYAFAVYVQNQSESAVHRLWRTQIALLL
jgi:hypothetical protein